MKERSSKNNNPRIKKGYCPHCGHDRIFGSRGDTPERQYIEKCARCKKVLK